MNKNWRAAKPRPVPTTYRASRYTVRDGLHTPSRVRSLPINLAKDGLEGLYRLPGIEDIAAIIVTANLHNLSAFFPYPGPTLKSERGRRTPSR